MTEPELLTPAEVAALFRVDAKTVTRWAQQHQLTSVRTLGGHRRYYAAEIQALLNSGRSCGPDALQTLVDDHYDGDPLRALRDLAERCGIAVTVLDHLLGTQVSGRGTPVPPAAAADRSSCRPRLPQGQQEITIGRNDVDQDPTPGSDRDARVHK